MRTGPGVRGSMLLFVSALAVTSCAAPATDDAPQPALVPSEVIDLGAVVTEDLPERMWGSALLNQLGFTESNNFNVIPWTFPAGDEEVSGSNAYYTLFNHGGPHVDAPRHVGIGGGIDSYPVEAFIGPLKVFDVRGHTPGRTVPRSVFEGRVEPGDVVLILTGYEPPLSDDQIPSVVTLSNEAAEYLAGLPIKAYGTDSFSVEALDDPDPPWIHHTLLSRGIPVYEQLFNMENLLGRDTMLFVGVPLNIEDGDGMIVRPVVFVY